MKCSHITCIKLKLYYLVFVFVFSEKSIKFWCENACAWEVTPFLQQKLNGGKFQCLFQVFKLYLNIAFKQRHDNSIEQFKAYHNELIHLTKTCNDALDFAVGSFLLFQVSPRLHFFRNRWPVCEMVSWRFKVHFLNKQATTMYKWNR